MPIHDWSHAPRGLFHHFHQFWSVQICTALNEGRLPEGYYALVEQHAVGLVPDVLTLHETDKEPNAPRRGGGVAVADAPPRTRFVAEAEEDLYVLKANRVAVRTPGGRVVAIVEILSPGNKGSRAALRSFVGKTMDFLRQGIHLLVIDILPPSPRDPQGIHKAVWDEIREEPFELPESKPLTLAAYVAGIPRRAYVEPVAVGDPLPDMPLFIDPDTYVLTPLEQSYQAAWALCPKQFKDAVFDSGRTPGKSNDV